MGRRRTNRVSGFNVYEYGLINDRVFMDYYIRLKNLACNMFEWSGLPKGDGETTIGIDERFLEKKLFENGFILYFKDEMLGDIVLPCTIAGRLNIYDIPTVRHAFADNGYNTTRGEKDSVLIFNNYEHYPTALTIQLFALRLYEIERAINTNIQNQKTPYVWLCEQSEITTVQNAYREIQENKPYMIFNRKNKIFEDGIQKIDLTVPYHADELYEMKRKTLNECYEFLGVLTTQNEKAERKIQSEVMSDNGIALANRYSMLNARREAAEKINRMFGTNIEVNFRQQIDTFNTGAFSTTEYPPLIATPVGGDEDVKIYG